jgi:GT2 family glycosyltransferase
MAVGGPAIDVAIVTWNTRETTLEALRSLLASERDGALAVHVRDNASSDGSARAIRSELPDVSVDAGEENLGFAAGVNTILRRTHAPWCLLLNSDAWPEPGAISRMVACAERHPRAAVVAARLERPDGSLEPSAWPFPSLRVAVSTIFRADRHVWSHAEERQVDWAVGAALLIRREALREVGEFDESLFMYAEDLEWCWRVRDSGWEIWFAPDAVVRHIGNASGVQKFGARQPAAWIANSARVYRRRHSAIGTLAWRLSCAAGAWVQVRRCRRDAEQRDMWRLQVRAWLQPPTDLGQTQT